MDQSEWTQIFQIAAKNLKQGHSWSLECDENLDHQEWGWKKCMLNTAARFRCTDCGRGWSSNKVMVVCHMRLAAHGQGVVKVRPSRQKCKICSDGPMEKPEIDSHNIHTLMRNLVEKIRIRCYNEDLGRKKKHFISYEGNNPHEPKHCEACMRGYCPRS